MHSHYLISHRFISTQKIMVLWQRAERWFATFAGLQPCGKPSFLRHAEAASPL
jgi:hypothetical protein